MPGVSGIPIPAAGLFELQSSLKLLGHICITQRFRLTKTLGCYFTQAIGTVLSWSPDS